MTMQSMAPERTSMSQISSACSPVSGWEMSTSSMSTPEARGVDRVERVLGVDEGDDAAHAPGPRRGSASASVVLPLDSGP